MPIQGEIKTLYKNKNNTSPIFPTTKVKAVSDENGIGLDALLRDNYATKTYVTNEIAKAQVGGDGSEIDLSGFATKDDVANIKHPISSVNNKTGEVILTAEDVGARSNTWMPTAEQVGAHPNTWLPTPAQIGAASIEQLNAQAEAFLSHYVPFNAKTICFSIKGKNLGFYARYPVTLHIASKMSFMGFIQFNVNSTDGAPIEGAYMLYGNLPILSFKYHTNGDTTTYLLESHSWNFWGGVEVKTFAEFAVKGLNDTTLESGTEMVRVKGVTSEQIGAAPAGYGLGGSFQSNLVATTNDKAVVDTWKNNGWYRYINDTVALFPNYTDGCYVTIRVEAYNDYSCTQTAYFIANKSYSLRRACVSGVWTEWEWENPPMALGVEYRTTERWNGKAVYAVLLDFGAMPSNDSKTVGTGIIATHTISCELSLEDSDGFSYTNSPEIVYYRATASGTILMEIETSYDYSNTTAYFLIKYIVD